MERLHRYYFINSKYPVRQVLAPFFLFSAFQIIFLRTQILGLDNLSFKLPVTYFVSLHKFLTPLGLSDLICRMETATAPAINSYSLVHSPKCWGWARLKPRT